MKPWTPQIKSTALIAALGLLAFFGTLHSPFVYDDLNTIVDNPYIANLSEFQSTVGIENIFNRSVLLLTFAVNRAIGQLDVFGFHLGNILIHVCVGIVFYFLTAELLFLESSKSRTRLQRLPLLASLIYLLHPLAVEPVSYLSSRSSLLATLFYLLSFFYFVRFLRGRSAGKEETGKFLYPVLSLLYFLLGTGTKGIIVTLPVMAAVYFWFQSGEANPRKLAPALGAILLPLFLYAGYRALKTGSLLTLKTDPTALLMDRGLYFLTQVKEIVFYYLLKLFLPLNLNLEPDARLVSGIGDPGWMAGLAIMLVLGTGIWLWGSRLMQFAFLWALVTILPTSSIVPLKQIVTEHRAYLPGVGISLFLGRVFLSFPGLAGRRAVLAYGFILLLSALTLNRGLDFRGEVILWEDTARKSPRKALVHNNLAAAYLGVKRYEAARRELERTLRLNPRHSDAYINVGHIDAHEKRWRQARDAFDRAIELGSAKAGAFYNAGKIRMRLNRPAEAVPFLEKAAAMKPHVAEFHFELANAYRIIRRYDEALLEYRQALKIQPGHIQALNNIGVIFWNLKDFGLAEKQFKKVLAQGEDGVEIHNNLASLYMLKNRYGEAIPHLKRLIALQPHNVKARQMLRAALALKDGNRP